MELTKAEIYEKWLWAKEKAESEDWDSRGRYSVESDYWFRKLMEFN